MIVVLILNIVGLIVAGIVSTILLVSLLRLKKKDDATILKLKYDVDYYKSLSKDLAYEIEYLKRGRH